MSGQVFVVEASVAKPRGIFSEVMESLGDASGEGVRTSVDHAVLRERDLVLQMEIGTDNVCKAATDLVASEIMCLLVTRRIRICSPCCISRYPGLEAARI